MCPVTLAARSTVWLRYTPQNWLLSDSQTLRLGGGQKEAEGAEETHKTRDDGRLLSRPERLADAFCHFQRFSPGLLVGVVEMCPEPPHQLSPVFAAGRNRFPRLKPEAYDLK